MVASANPKKKHTYETKETQKDKKALVESSTSSELSATDEMLEQHFGTTLLTSVGSKPKPTTSLLKGKELVALYFSASWYVAIHFFKTVDVQLRPNLTHSNSPLLLYHQVAQLQNLHSSAD